MYTSTQDTLIPDLEAIIDLRHVLHQHPDLSGHEEQTAERIVQFMKQYQPDEVLTGLGGTGVAVIFNGDEAEGPTLLFRAELDALLIAETNFLPYLSVKEGIGHKCGHEGHMAILAGLASLLHRQKPGCGKVILLFQPAEETGAGAWNVLHDQNFQKLKPEYVFALHNMPGLPLHQVLVSQSVFSPASTGMSVEFFGKSSHAGEPENGLNPGVAMSELILVNILRSRAGLDPKPLGLAKDKVLDAIFYERRMEFTWEPTGAFSDLNRRGRFLDFIKANRVDYDKIGVATKPWLAQTPILLPIPQLAWNVNKSLVQNPGYPSF